MKVGFEEVLEEKRALVWPVIEEYLEKLVDFPSYCSVPERYKKEVLFHQGVVAEYPQRKGKYLRPTLLLLTAGAMGCSEQRALLTAAAMQTSEDWILNHDDIEDGSLERRGKPALYRMVGKELAINAGDGLQVLMWKMLKDNLKVVGIKEGLRVIEEFYQMLNRTILGQTMEIKWTLENKLDLEVEDVLFILESKTGYYTIGGPMRLGAILAGGTEDEMKALYDFGKILGRSFQIIDDILDLTSDFKGLKRQRGNDIYEGKRTVLLVELLRRLEEKEKKKVIAMLGKKREEKTQEEVEEVIGLMKKNGVIDWARKLAMEFALEAREMFEKRLLFLKKEPEREFLRMGIDFIVEREY